MTSVDKAAIAWSIAIVAVGVGIAGMGMQGDIPQAGITVPTPPPAMEEVMEPLMEEAPPTKTRIVGYERAISEQDPGLGHESHQLAVLIAPSAKVYSGTLIYDASEPVQLVSLMGPLKAGEDRGQPIWTPDGETKFALTLVDPKKSSGEWKFEGNALAVHTMKTTPFIVDYKITNLSEKTTKAPAPMMKEEPKTTAPKTARVSMPAGTSVPGCEETNACYVPASVTVAVGGIVTWSNDDTAAHTVTSGSPTGGPDGVFDSSLVMGGSTFQFTFNNAGTYDYFCMVHPWMVGTVKVV